MARCARTARRLKIGQDEGQKPEWVRGCTSACRRSASQSASVWCSSAGGQGCTPGEMGGVAGGSQLIRSDWF